MAVQYLKDTLQLVLGEMYSGVKVNLAAREMRRHKILAMAEETQLFILSEPYHVFSEGQRRDRPGA